MPEGREFLLRRHFAIHQASRRGGWAGTLEFVVDPAGPGSEWLSTVRAHEFLEVIGPLGTAFAYPKRHTNCLLVAEGHGAASLYFLAQELLARHKRVDMVVGAETLERVFKPIEGKRLSQTISIVTADGTLGERGSVMDALPEMVEATEHRGALRGGDRRASLRDDRRLLQGTRHPRAGGGRGAHGLRARARARRASCRSPARTAAGTTTCGRASTARCSIRRACSGTDGSPRRRRCCRRRPRACRWCGRGRGEADALGRPGRARRADPGA